MKKYLFPALLIAIVSPAVVAKPLTAGIVALICVAYFQQFLSDKAAVTKLVIAGMLFPGTLITFAQSPGDLLRLAPLWLLVLLYPYERMSVSMRLLNRTALWLLVYLVGSGILIGLEFGPALDFRARWYPFEREQITWSYAALPGLFFMYGETRVGGLFYNPNVLAGHLFFLYVVFFLTNELKSQDRKYKWTFVGVSILTAYGIYLTATRTFTLAFIVFLVWWFYFPQIRGRAARLLRRRRPVYVNFLAILLVLALAGLGGERILQAFEATGSANIKFSILRNYLIESSKDSNGLFQLLFGGEFNRQFDAEWGYWIGGIGFVGTFGILTLYWRMVRTYPRMTPIVLALLGAGFGNSLLYALGTGLEVVATMVVVGNYSLVRGPKKEFQEPVKKRSKGFMIGNEKWPSKKVKRL